MLKNKLVLIDDGCGINSPHLSHLYNKFFEFEQYDPKKTYDKLGNIFVFPPAPIEERQLQVQLNDQGYKTAINNLWEANFAETLGVPYQNIGYRLYNKNWFWYHESFLNRNLTYNQYTPIKNCNKLALMLLNRQRFHRDTIVDKLAPYLKNILYSYASKGIQMPNDATTGDWQRFFNPDWYDTTCFSLVAEAEVDRPLITEKTYKPIAFYHPFLIVGHPGILQDLKDNGFETFDNIFDESYDLISNTTQRLNSVIDNLIKLIDVDYLEIARDIITRQKLQHNHDLFFDEQIITKKIIEEFFNPLLEYASTS
jgi:hypothetical protein